MFYLEYSFLFIMPAAVNTGGVPFFDRQIVIQWICGRAPRREGGL